MDNREGYNGKTCHCHHHKVIPGLVTLAGIGWLLQVLGYLTVQFMNIAWPVLLIVAGLTWMFGKKCGCCGRHM